MIRTAGPTERPSDTPSPGLPFITSSPRDRRKTVRSGDPAALGDTQVSCVDAVDGVTMTEPEPILIEDEIIELSETELEEHSDDEDYQVVRLLPKPCPSDRAAEPTKRLEMRRTVSEMPLASKIRLMMKPEVGLPVPSLKHCSSFVDPLRGWSDGALESSASHCSVTQQGTTMELSQEMADSQAAAQSITPSRESFDWNAHGFNKGEVMDADFQPVKKGKYLVTVTLRPDVQSTYKFSVTSTQKEQILSDLIHLGLSSAAAL